MHVIYHPCLNLSYPAKILSTLHIGIHIPHAIKITIDSVAFTIYLHSVVNVSRFSRGCQYPHSVCGIFIHISLPYDLPVKLFLMSLMFLIDQGRHSHCLKLNDIKSFNGHNRRVS